MTVSYVTFNMTTAVHINFRVQSTHGAHAHSGVKQSVVSVCLSVSQLQNVSYTDLSAFIGNDEAQNLFYLSFFGPALLRQPSHGTIHQVNVLHSAYRNCNVCGVSSHVYSATAIINFVLSDYAEKRKKSLGRCWKGEEKNYIC